MNKLGALAATMVLGCAVGLSQTGPTASAPQSDSQTLQAILAEMRGIHNDVRLSQTTQILLTEMEVQRGVVDKATEKRDNARNRAAALLANEKNMASQLAMLQESASATIDPVALKRITDQEQNVKNAEVSMKSQEDSSVNDVTDTENSLRKEQETLTGIQDQLNDVVKKLQPANK